MSQIDRLRIGLRVTGTVIGMVGLLFLPRPHRLRPSRSGFEAMTDTGSYRDVGFFLLGISLAALIASVLIPRGKSRKATKAE